jgi:probable F420-dependent oxidoreductase
MAMQYGLYLPNFGAFGDARTVMTLAREAEQAGWDGFFLWDHIASGEGPVPMVDPWVALAAIAASTERIRIGTTVTPLPRRRPWKLARETASLDRLSGGRLVLGVGIGLGEAEWHDLGEEPDQKVRGAMLDEALDILVGLWSGEPFSYQGRHYQVRNAHFLPRPVQQPRIPIWVGGFWPNKAPYRRAARWDGVFPLFTDAEQIDAQWPQMMDFVRSQRSAEGPFDVLSIGESTPGEPTDAAEREAAGVTWWLELLIPWRFGYQGEGPWPLEVMRERVLAGPPRE